MRELLFKEMKLSASVLSYLFILFGFLFFAPGYPILCGAFFVTLGLYQSFQDGRETNDITFSALLPVAKKDVVRAKFLFCILIEGAGFLVMTGVTLVRMLCLNKAPAYTGNALMNANPYALGMALVISGLFNLVFIGGFFRNAHDTGKPFVRYTVIAFLAIFMGEAVHFVPGCAAVNGTGTERLGLQHILFLGGCAGFAGLTLLSLRLSCARFEKTDL